jgi:predicted SAM-dependent methyltransferase
MQVHLRPRLAAAAAFLSGAQTVADVGADHGRLAAALLQQGLARCVIASDVSADSLAKARSLAHRCGIPEDVLVFAVSDGLLHLAPGEADALVFAGMGGELIARLLERGAAIAQAAERVVMQPMGGTLELRRYLLQNGYTIADERLVFDAGRYYQVILAKPGISQSVELPCDALLEFGPIAFAKRDPLLYPALLRCRDGRLRRMYKAEQEGVVPAQLALELRGVQDLVDILERETNK